MAAVQSQSVIEKLEAINKKQEEQIQNLETKAIQLTNLYFVFQGVILSSISSASPVKCHNWWIPFCLSLIAALLNLVSVFGTIRYFLKCSEELDQNYEDAHQESVRQRMLDTIVHANGHVQFQSSQSEQEGDGNGPKPDPVKQRKRRVLCYAAMGLLLGFSCIILYGCKALLCDCDCTPKDKCVKLC
ncbi:hypothetical protein FH972_012265 [Carpinus fangiana]|uniref:Uncharacterized protein n=1 Tax=Carpinus fangiana TaxID=176857 RepID=A0A5N6R5M6_9ROSI|nr:hypothetical protein FH972_012265 [Carpinus fangiana]